MLLGWVPRGPGQGGQRACRADGGSQGLPGSSRNLRASPSPPFHLRVGGPPPGPLPLVCR